MKTPRPTDGIRGNQAPGTALGVAHKMGAPIQYYNSDTRVWVDRADHRVDTPLTSSVYYRVKPVKE